MIQVSNAYLYSQDLNNLSAIWSSFEMFCWLLGDTCGKSIESIILTIMQINYAVQRGAKIEKNPAFDPLVKGRKIGDYLDAATRMYALINQSGAMLS